MLVHAQEVEQTICTFGRGKIVKKLFLAVSGISSIVLHFWFAFFDPSFRHKVITFR